jgi:hypothetical protein
VVVYIIVGNNGDSVLYGYAFRDHWMWYNGLLLDSGNYVSFIIWKDYNCITWYTINSNDASHSTFDSATNTLIYNALVAYSTGRLTDIWWTAVDLIESIIASNSAFQGTDKAYTIIVSQSYGARFFGRVCAKYYHSYTSGVNIGWDSSVGNWGQPLILQMR